MGVYINGMDMPHSCGECYFRCIAAYETGRMCTLLKRYITDDTRKSDCPLVEIPKHGRLIDADAIISFIDTWHLRDPKELSWSDSDVVDMIRRCPTVIEAEE